MKIVPIIFILLLFNSKVYPENLNDRGSRPTICLNMIVKNETAVIKRALASVKPLIDTWVIVDTGSTDGTQEMIREFLQDIPGELHERPWVDFAHNRNQALELAKEKAEYILLIDADEILHMANDFCLPTLDQDYYHVEVMLSGTKYHRIHLIKSCLDWEWKGVLHEALYSGGVYRGDILAGLMNTPTPEGSRSQDPQKYEKDAVVLEKALEIEPDNTRYVFYLAQSYRDAGNHERALKNYEKRIGMGGWDQELFWSYLQVAIMKESLEAPAKEIIDSYYKAYAYRPSRIEPLYRLALYHRTHENYEEAYKIASTALCLPESDDLLFVEKWIYEYGILIEYSVAAYEEKRYLEALLASKMILNKPNIPENVRSCVQNNLIWINRKLEEEALRTPSTVQQALDLLRVRLPLQQEILFGYEHQSNLGVGIKLINCGEDQIDGPLYNEESYTITPLCDQCPEEDTTSYDEPVIEIINPPVIESIECCDVYSCGISNLYIRTTAGQGRLEIKNFVTGGLYTELGRRTFKPFFNAEGDWLQGGNWAASVGTGFRYLDECAQMVYGVYGYYDYLGIGRGIQQASLGFEYSSYRFDFFGSYYWEIGSDYTIGQPEVLYYPGGFYTTRSVIQRLIQGAEINIGTSWARWEPVYAWDLFVSAGVYQYYFNNDGNVAFSGQIYRAEFNYFDIFSIKAIYTYDKMFHSTIQGILQINILLGDCRRIFCWRAQNTCVVNGVTGAPPRRQNIIILPKPCCTWQSSW